MVEWTCNTLHGLQHCFRLFFDVHALGTTSILIGCLVLEHQTHFLQLHCTALYSTLERLRLLVGRLLVMMVANSSYMTRSRYY
jgi:hypothetical protein